MPKSPEQFDFSKEEDQEKFENLPKKNQEKIISESQIEANILKGKIELGEVKGFNEALSEFNQEFIEKTQEEIKKREIVTNFSLQNLKVLNNSADDADAFKYRHCVSGAGKYSGMSGGTPGDAYDIVAFASPDYEDASSQRSFIREAKGNLIILEAPSGDSDGEIFLSLNTHTLGKIEGIDTKEIKDSMNLRHQIWKQLETNPDLMDKMHEAYYVSFDNQAIAVEEEEGVDFEGAEIRDMINHELENGTYIIDALKKAEQEGLIKIKHIPSFYTDPQEMKLREDEINSILEERLKNIKSYIKERIKEEIYEKIKEKKKLEEKQELISKKYGKVLDESNLDSKTLERLNNALLKFNNDESHSRMYREYEMTKGLDIKDDIAVFVAEESSLNLEGKGGEEIDIKLVMVDKEKTKEIQKFHVRDQWDPKKDDFDKWYDDIKIESFDKEKGLITLKLTRSRDNAEDVIKIKIERE